MSDTIKLGNLEISSFKVGSSDCKIYLGSTLLYPSEPPTPTFKWKATYTGGTTSSAQCDASSTAILTGEINKTDLVSLEIGDCVTSIGASAIRAASALTSVTIGNSVTTINNTAFGYCGGLTSVVIPDSVTTIQQEAFRYCTGLTNVTIGSGVTSIDDYAFGNCDNLKIVTINATTPPSLASDVFYYTFNITIFVPLASVNAYKTAWSSYADRIVGIPDGIAPLAGIERKAGNLGWVDLGLGIGTDFQINITLNYKRAGGSTFVGCDNTFRWFMASTTTYFDYNGQRISRNSTTAYPMNRDYTVQLKNYSMKSSLNSVTTSGTTQSSYVSTNNLKLYSTNTSSNLDLGIVYNVRVYTGNGSTLVGHFVPVKVISENRVTMYNAVTNTLCQSTGNLYGIES